MYVVDTLFRTNWVGALPLNWYAPMSQAALEGRDNSARSGQRRCPASGVRGRRADAVDRGDFTAIGARAVGPEFVHHVHHRRDSRSGIDLALKQPAGPVK